ncbi:MAG: DegT/DnrJ/EryC1/StrS family aminotransferase [Clostridiales bacterium]|nr:DegT/DnrJ/EryC1/StrS family aminotransferase [Clostridiales bacterium]
MAIQLFVPTFDVDACLSEIRECLDKGWTGMGFKTVEIEKAWCQYTGFPYSCYINSNTAGLNMAVEILKMQNGWVDDDEIITTPLTFVSTNHAILLGEMRAVFADVDDTLCLDPEEIEKKITDRTRAVMYVGFGGNTGRYEDVVALCKKHNLRLILDAAHMAGTRLNGVIPGREADAVIYSFQAVKNLPTGDSGMICFMDEEYARIVRKLAWLGINKDTYTRTVSEGGMYKWKYDVEYVGYKYNGNALMAAVALAQLPHLDSDNAYRRQLSQLYTEGLITCGDKVKLISVPEGCESAQHLFQIMVEDRDGLMAYLNSHEIYPGVHYVDNIEYSMYRYAEGTCPNARYASDHIISLPLHMRLTREDVQTVVDTILSFVNYRMKI